MRKAAWIGALLAASALIACERHAVDPRRDATEPTANEETTWEARVRAELRTAKARLERDLDPPTSTAERERCPDESLAVDSTARTVIMRTRDARAERRSPLPLALVTRLETDEFSPVVAHLAGGAAALWDFEQARPTSPESAREALAALAALERRRYLAELRIEAHSDPKLFRRKDAPRSEWAPGAIAGRLVVYDLVTGRALCHARVDVRGDATGAPIRKRLREQTREKLRAALYDRTWAALEGALASITGRLVLPDPTRRNDPSQRWAYLPERVADNARR